ncbi:cysteine-rich VLP protein [Kyrpidia sp.]|uniref:cysteine-rich VLP protein n=1 Tax=Kyrpidia sp. TaxID=2073077 RepID=UPI00338D4229
MRKELKNPAKTTCANYGTNGNCLITDLECYVCRELTLEGQEPWRCRWFERAVLPNDSILEAGYRKALANHLGVEMEEDSTRLIKECAMCGKDFKATSNRAKYCHKCRPLHNRELKRKADKEYAKRKRSRSR